MLAESLGTGAAFRETDVGGPEQVRRLIEFAVAKFGGLHVMVNNAGMSGKRLPSFYEEDFADLREMALDLAVSPMAPRIVGTPEQVADTLEKWWRETGCYVSPLVRRCCRPA